MIPGENCVLLKTSPVSDDHGVHPEGLSNTSFQIGGFIDDGHVNFGVVFRQKLPQFFEEFLLLVWILRQLVERGGGGYRGLKFRPLFDCGYSD